MKKLIFLAIVIVVSFHLKLQAQQSTSGYLEEAQTAYAHQSYEDARFALQQAMVELDKKIGQEILNSLPTSIEDHEAQTGDDVFSGTSLGFTGVYVERIYTDEGGEQKIFIDVMNNSPFMAAVSSFLTNPLIAGIAGDPNQKVVKVKGYKGMLEKIEDESEEGKVSTWYKISIPIGNSLFSLESYITNEEKDMLAMANSVDLEKIAHYCK